MPKEGEIHYLDQIGPAAVVHAAGKPFSDPDCGRYLMDLGAVLSLLPPPPCKILDLGVGTGWTSLFLARRGYEVIGQDISPAMIELARAHQEENDRVRFVVGDYEELPYHEVFDAALFYDSLHHAEDERQALLGVHRALKPGSLCITVEPGEGHAAGALETARRYQVTEKDMPPRHIMKLAGLIGFRRMHVYERPAIKEQRTQGNLWSNLVRAVRAFGRELLGRPRRQALLASQIVVLEK